MATQALLQSIRNAARRQIKDVEENARLRVEQLMENTRREAEVIKNRVLSDGRAKLNRMQALIEQQAIIRALQIHADARHGLVEAALEKAQQAFITLRQREDYSIIFSHLVQEALDALRPSLMAGQRAILHIDPRDEHLCQQILKDLPEKPLVQTDLECFGGCVTESEDGLVTVRNTISDRYERALPLVRQELGVFFEEQVSAG